MHASNATVHPHRDLGISSEALLEQNHMQAEPDADLFHIQAYTLYCVNFQAKL